jgi:hypothetical protein
MMKEIVPTSLAETAGSYVGRMVFGDSPWAVYKCESGVVAIEVLYPGLLDWRGRPRRWPGTNIPMRSVYGNVAVHAKDVDALKSLMVP